MRALKQQQLHSVWLGSLCWSGESQSKILEATQYLTVQKKLCWTSIIVVDSCVCVCYRCGFLCSGSEVHLESKCLECSFYVTNAFAPILLCNNFMSALYSIQVIVILYLLKLLKILLTACSSFFNIIFIYYEFVFHSH